MGNDREPARLGNFRYAGLLCFLFADSRNPSPHQFDYSMFEGVAVTTIQIARSPFVDEIRIEETHASSTLT